MSEILFIGVGAALNSTFGKSCVVLDRTICIDVGADPTPGLRDSSINPNSVETILITHLHGDHFFGVAFLIAEAMVEERIKDLSIVGPHGTSAAVRSLLELAYPATPADKFLDKARVKFFEVVHGESISLPRFTLDAFRMDHGRTHALGYVVKLESQKICFSGDGQVTPEARSYFMQASTWVINCPTEETPIAGHSTVRDYEILAESCVTTPRVFVTHRTTESTGKKWTAPNDGDVFEI